MSLPTSAAVTPQDSESSGTITRSYPLHSSTRSRGYLGKDRSLDERSQNRKVDPRSECIKRMNWQSAHNPARDLLKSFTSNFDFMSVPKKNGPSRI